MGHSTLWYLETKQNLTFPVFFFMSDKKVRVLNQDYLFKNSIVNCLP